METKLNNVQLLYKYKKINGTLLCNCTTKFNGKTNKKNFIQPMY